MKRQDVLKSLEQKISKALIVSGTELSRDEEELLPELFQELKNTSGFMQEIIRKAN